MAKLNMTNMNTLFRKGYLLAGVVMAANMLVVNEMRAMDGNDSSINLNQQNQQEQIHTENTNNNKEKEAENKNASSLEKFLNFVLSCENTINLVGGVLFSGANNYFKWWDYNPGSYCNLRIGCLGWRSKKLFDIVQLDINLNLGRGISWSFLGVNNVIKGLNDENYAKPLYFSHLVARLFDGNGFMQPTAFIAVFLIQGFVSMPLTFHISNFSIAISFDSILWEFVIGRFLKDKDEQGEGEKNQYTSPLETVPITNEIN